MIYETLLKRKHVDSYDTEFHIDDSLVDDLLQKAWKVTPSKQNFMPYSIHVLGPSNNNYKKYIYNLCVSKNDEMNFHPDPKNQFYNLLNCSYLLIFSPRLETELNERQKLNINKGADYEPTYEKGLDSIKEIISLEIGLFSAAFTGLCLEHGLDTTYISCVERDLKRWKDLPFITRPPVFLLSVGKGQIYRQDIAQREGWAHTDLKPEYEKIVKFV